MLSGACSKDHYFDLLFPLQPISNNGCSLSHICTFFLSWIFSASLVSLCLKCCVDWGPRKPQELSQALSTWPLGLWWARPFPEHPGWCQEESGNEEHDLQQGNTPGSCDLWEELPARQEAGTQGIPTPHRAKMPHWSCARSQAYTIQDRSYLHEVPRVVGFLDTERWLPGAVGKAGMGRYLMGTELQFCKMERALEAGAS